MESRQTDLANKAYHSLRLTGSDISLSGQQLSIRVDFANKRLATPQHRARRLWREWGVLGEEGLTHCMFLYDFSYWESGLLHRPWPAHFLRNWTPWSLFYIRKVASPVRGAFPPCPVRIQTKFFGYQLSFLWLNSLDPPHPFSPTAPKSCSPSQLTRSNSSKRRHTHTHTHTHTCMMDMHTHTQECTPYMHAR